MKTTIIVVLIVLIVGVIQFFRNKKESLVSNSSELLEAGQLLFPNKKIQFESFFNSYSTDKEKFLSDNEDLLAEYDNFDLNKIKSIEIIYIFGDSNNQLFLTDWRGEETEREIENFMKNNLQIKSDWLNVNKLRIGISEEKQRDGKFIIELFKTIDKDLATMNKKLIFMDLGWDSYVYTVVDEVSYKTLIEKFGTHFHGTEKLKSK